MKRFLMLLVVALLIFTVVACSSTKNEPKPADSNQASATPAPTDSSKTSGTPAPADPSKSPAAPAPTDSSKANTTPAPADTSMASGTTTPAPADSTKPAATPAPADTSKPTTAPAPADTSKATTAPAPADSSSGATTPAPVPQPDDKPAPAPAPQSEVSPKGKKVLLVGRDSIPLPAEDVAIANRLKGMGFVVTNFIDREITADATKGYDLIYISQTTNSKFLKGGVMKDVAIPTIYVKSQGMFYLGLSSIEEGSTVKKIKAVDIVDSKHKIAGGLSGTVDVFNEAGDNFGISYGLPGKEAKVIASVPGDKTKAAIYYYDKGAKADNGYTVKARLSFFFWSNGMQDNSTDAGWKLLDNTVLWTLQNG